MKEISLTQGKVALVDDIYFDELNQYNWYAGYPAHNYYAMRRGPIYMHRYITELFLSRKLVVTEVIDHIDSNGLNNQITNLRIVSYTQNAIHKRKRIGTSSKYTGVHKPTGRSK